MDLDSAAQRLGVLARSPVRPFSTYDFGREQDPRARSVIVREKTSKQILRALRAELDAGLVAFIGTTQWLGQERRPGAELVVAHGEAPLDIPRIARTDAVNYGMDTEAVVAKLAEFHERFGIDIYHAETDSLEFAPACMPEDLAAFSEEIYEFCPDIVDQGVGTVERLQRSIRESQSVYLWWD
jgi:hypothetical protein